ncbi:MAG: hypothetical protein R3C18_26015 [Planctomycetaceae bacterium]
MNLRQCFGLLALMLFSSSPIQGEEAFWISTFSADVTIPLGHRCMGVLPTKSVSVSDPLEIHGFVLGGSNQPVVVAAVDWCEIRNGAYDDFREALANAVGTTRERVLLSSLHQHDAPVVDSDAARILREVGLANELHDEQFFSSVIERTIKALKAGLKEKTRVTHVGTGKAKVREIASNRRVVYPDGRISFDRGSRSGGDSFHAEQPEGQIDPFVRTISFWNGETPVLALSVYATHPMSYYGRGEISADFVGLARRQRQQALPNVKQIYASGCSGDVTAGKFNNGSQESRVALTNRLAAGMADAWKDTKRVPLTQLRFRNTSLQLEYYGHASLTEERLTAEVNDESLRTEDRILAAMGLASRQRVSSGQAIDVPCLDFGSAKIVLLPGEAFVGYQLMAQVMDPESFVVVMGYGECWPGYIPTDAAFADHFHDKWLWVAPGSEKRMEATLQKVLRSVDGNP